MNFLTRLFLKTPEQIASEQLLQAQRALLDAYCSLEAEQLRVSSLQARIARLKAVQAAQGKQK